MKIPSNYPKIPTLVGLLLTFLCTETALSLSWHNPVSISWGTRDAVLDYASVLNNEHRLAYFEFRSQSTSQQLSKTGIGLGYRQFVSPTTLVGGYVFHDLAFNTMEPTTAFLNLNIGLEWWIDAWRIGVNAYIPLDSSPPVQYYQGHQILMKESYYEGGYGFDLKLAHTYKQNITPSGGIYVLRNEEARYQLGAVAGLEYTFNRFFEGFVKGSVDQRGRTLTAGIKLTLWSGRNPTSNDPYHRLWRNPDRYLAPFILTHRVLKDDIRFFATDTTMMIAKGTFEDPLGFIPENLSKLPPDVLCGLFDDWNNRGKIQWFISNSRDERVLLNRYYK